MRCVSVTIAITAILAASTPSRAQDCDAAEDQTTMSICAGEAYKDTDAALNEAYGRIAERLADDPDTQALLVKAQRGWIAFRDAECAFAASGVEGGSVQPMIVANCLAGLTEARTEDLLSYLDCEEGDLSCPVP